MMKRWCRRKMVVTGRQSNQALQQHRLIRLTPSRSCCSSHLLRLRYLRCWRPQGARAASAGELCSCSPSVERSPSARSQAAATSSWGRTEVASLGVSHYSSLMDFGAQRSSAGAISPKTCIDLLERMRAVRVEFLNFFKTTPQRHFFYK